MPIMTKRTYPASNPVPEIEYVFELNQEETKKFFDEFLDHFFDPTKLGDLEVGEQKVEFSMKFFKKEPQQKEESEEAMNWGPVGSGI